MGRRLTVFLLLAAFLFISCACMAEVAKKNYIENIRYGTTSNGVRIVFDMNDKTDYRAFILDKPYRIVVDLPEVAWKQARSSLLNSNRIISGYRSGIIDSGLTRVVFDIKEPAIIKSVFPLAKDSSNPQRLVVDLERSSVNMFNAQKDVILGNKNLTAAAKPATLAQPASLIAAADGKKLAAANPTVSEPEVPTPQVSAPAEVAKPQKNAALQLAPVGAAKKPIAPNSTLKGAAKILPNTEQVQQNTVKQPNNAAKSAAVNSDTQATIPVKPIVPQKRVVVIDAGHGGADPGAMFNGTMEKNITLMAARELKRQMDETGKYKVILTRDSDFYVKLTERKEIARKVKADLFISLHADSIDRKDIRGASLYTLSEKASDSETARLAENENNSGFVAGVDLGNESQEVADILIDLAMREKMNESNLFAKYLHNSFNTEEVSMLASNPTRSAGFAVLKAPDVPSVLIEMGFISNPQEVKLLTSSVFQRKLAGAVLKGADAYFRKIEAIQK